MFAIGNNIFLQLEISVRKIDSSCCAAENEKLTFFFFFSSMCETNEGAELWKKHSTDLPEVDSAESKMLPSASNYAGISKAATAPKLQ